LAEEIGSLNLAALATTSGACASAREARKEFGYASDRRGISMEALMSVRNGPGARSAGGAGGSGGRGAGVAVEFFVALWVGFVVFQVVVPVTVGRGIETESVPWLNGVNVGLILAMGLIVAGVVLAAVNAGHGE
jgi:hypothetical protein